MHLGTVIGKFGLDVSGVEVLEPAIKGTPLEACMTKGVKAFRFPKNLGPVRAMTVVPPGQK